MKVAVTEIVHGDMAMELKVAKVAALVGKK